jgi:hypothetical protein
MAENGATPTPEEQVRRLYETAERSAADAAEQLVGREGFGVLLSKVAENTIAMTKIANDIGDLVLRNLRIAGRADITRLARQLNRTEDKLEQLLQEVEALHADVRRADGEGAADVAPNGAGRAG